MLITVQQFKEWRSYFQSIAARVSAKNIIQRVCPLLVALLKELFDSMNHTKSIHHQLEAPP